MQKPVLLPAGILLPGEDADWGRWAVLACDQFTSQPAYWKQVAEQAGEAPSTLNMILPEVYLETPGAQARVGNIHACMQRYLQTPLTRRVEGFVYVERQMKNGAIRQGLVGCVDLEDYSYTAGTQARIRPSEGTVVERIPPRLAVRRGAALESPHILMLADDPAESVIEPLAGEKNALQPLYGFDLMLGGGHVAGWAVTQPAQINRIQAALASLEQPGAFHARYGSQGKTEPFALAVGDGNHSLATAKAWWEELKPTLSAEQQKSHPARWCLVELENIQSPAIEIEPIHRVIFHLDSATLLWEALNFARKHGAVMVKAGEEGQNFGIWEHDLRTTFTFQNLPWPLAVASLEVFLGDLQKRHPEVKVDYVHGEQAVGELAAQGATGVLLPALEKGDLFRGIALGGALPRKAFSMGHAEEKRYYIECRKIIE